jgi:tyrosine-protein kinase Etk/Wzc
VLGQEKQLVVNKEFNPMIIGVILRRHWKIPFYFILIFSFIAFLYLRYTKPVYSVNSILQIVEEDKVGEVLGTVATSQKRTDISQEVEFLGSNLLIGRAISKINLDVNLNSEGKLLTKDLYKTKRFEIKAISLFDSTLCGKRIDILYSNKKIQLEYLNNGVKRKIKVVPNTAIKTNDFEIFIKVPNFLEFEDACNPLQ